LKGQSSLIFADASGFAESKSNLFRDLDRRSRFCRHV
jgi:hypothetical protein